jgi:hypothetical protein
MEYMRYRFWGALIAAIILAHLGFTQAQAGQREWQAMFAPCPATEQTVMVGSVLTVEASPCGMVAPAVAKKGWQGIATFTVTTGTPSLEYSYSCPAAFPVAWNGGYEFVGSANQLETVYTTAVGPRLDEGPSTGFAVYAWHFTWPSGGAPAGTQIYFDAFCQKAE